MKEVEVEGSKVLLARDQGAYYAVSAKCTHFGASLAKGKVSISKVTYQGLSSQALIKACYVVVYSY